MRFIRTGPIYAIATARNGTWSSAEPNDFHLQYCTHRILTSVIYNTILYVGTRRNNVVKMCIAVHTIYQICVLHTRRAANNQRSVRLYNIYVRRRHRSDLRVYIIDGGT